MAKFQPKFTFPPPICALLIDISGTLLIGSSPIPGAAQALSTLRAARIPFRLCSNTSKESSHAMYERIRTAGLDVRREELWTSIGALRVVLKELGVKRPYMLLSKSALEECTDEPVRSDLSDASSALPPSSPYDAVVVGLAPPLLDYTHLNTAFRILVGENQPRDTPVSPTGDQAPHSNAHSGLGLGVGVCIQPRPPLIALHKARYLEAPDHALSLGPGPFVHALEEAAQTSATVVGKPTRAFFEAVLRDLERNLDVELGDDAASTQREGDRDRRGRGQSPSTQTHRCRWEGIAVIGDDVLADLGEGAVELGLWRVLVKTGKYRPGDENRQDVLPPDQVCVSFAEFVGMLHEQRTCPGGL
ncbi:HAD-like domain-containing protein [Boletus reticuloceps]|uniref:HAD-like domain-containing protein n=1 Tax=Boletus reticuloceps TaxID=495285 RepID=A0A8I2YXK7_9AGAM|nr:HAD-like domain-containing protein [Boletus reticuloceps]